MHDKEVADWLRFAQMDSDTAEYLDANMHPKPMEIICYHCQQAVEKSLKAILIKQDEDIVKTHDLGFLTDLIAKKLSVPNEILVACAKLTQYSVRVRYPQEFSLTEENVKNAIRNMEISMEWCRKTIANSDN